jgi:malto-oligosyltrehalose trehalohydrolase
VTLFRVWAPEATRADVDMSGQRYPMAPAAEPGWWTAETPGAGDGTDYGFRLDGGDPLPDPRSPRQPFGVKGASRTYDHSAFAWTDRGWRGGPLHGSVSYELHVGTFTPEGTLDAAVDRLGHLSGLGVDTVQLMPVAAFPGEHGWGYDGIHLWAVHEPYGGPDALKRFVDACHARRLAVLLDVVYNHVGVGNQLAAFGPYFTEAHVTPWGPAVNLDQPGSDEVRAFLIENALMWLRDYHLDGLRLDAVHAFEDHRAMNFLEQLTAEVQALAALLNRDLVLIAESDLNDPRLVTSREAGGYGLTAQWSDDFHHAVHAAITGERQGYYCDFGSMGTLAYTMTRVFFHDGRWSAFRGRSHGRQVDIFRVPAHRFLCYLQNHDQVGNRAAGDRIAADLHPDMVKGGGGAGADRPVYADAVHGRGVGRGHPLAVLHRPRGSVAGRRGGPGAPRGVRPVRLGRRGRARPAGRRHLHPVQAGLVAARPGQPPGHAGLVHRADRAAPRPAGADRPAPGPGPHRL